MRLMGAAGESQKQTGTRNRQVAAANFCSTPPSRPALVSSPHARVVPIALPEAPSFPPFPLHTGPGLGVQRVDEA